MNISHSYCYFLTKRLGKFPKISLTHPLFKDKRLLLVFLFKLYAQKPNNKTLNFLMKKIKDWVLKCHQCYPDILEYTCTLKLEVVGGGGGR